MRHLTSQSAHDLQIDIAAILYRRQGFYVFTNPGHEKRQPVDGEYPDLVCLYGLGALARIAEIETAETVSLDHSQQWRSYAEIAARYGVPFDLWVPSSSVVQARQLLAAVRDSVRIVEW